VQKPETFYVGFRSETSFKQRLLNFCLAALFVTEKNDVTRNERD
jgi:hypothetical protein